MINPAIYDGDYKTKTRRALAMTLKTTIQIHG